MTSVGFLKKLRSGELFQRGWMHRGSFLRGSGRRARHLSEPIGAEQERAGRVKPIRDKMGGTKTPERGVLPRAGRSQSEPSRAGLDSGSGRSPGSQGRCEYACQSHLHLHLHLHLRFSPAGRTQSRRVTGDGVTLDPLVMAYPGYGGGFGSFIGQMPGMQMQMGQPVPVLPGGYPGHPAYLNNYSSAEDPMWTYFAAVAGQDGEVDAEELQKCLTQSGISGTYSPFSLETCRIMIAMLDRDYTGKMGFNEFKELWTALTAWKQNFITIDQDRSGTVEHYELNQAIAAMGYRLSPQTLSAIVKRYSKNGRIFFDDYVACCVKLRALTDFFRRRDHLQQGVVNFIYDDFLQGTMAI